MCVGSSGKSQLIWLTLQAFSFYSLSTRVELNPEHTWDRSGPSFDWSILCHFTLILHKLNSSCPGAISTQWKNPDLEQDWVQPSAISLRVEAALVQGWIFSNRNASCFRLIVSPAQFGMDIFFGTPCIVSCTTFYCLWQTSVVMSFCIKSQLFDILQKYIGLSWEIHKNMKFSHRFINSAVL